MKLLVTGATGFIGSAFVRLASAKGHRIAGLIHSTHPPPTPAPSAEPPTWMTGTLKSPPWKQIETFQPEACVHLAWIATPGIYLESPENKQWFEWSLEFVRKLWGMGTKHIVVAGTCIEYRPSDRPLSEDSSPIEPATTYSQYKNALRLTLEQDVRTSGGSLCWGRVFYPYGVGEHPARLGSSIIQKLSRGEEIVLKTPLSTKDYIYVDDLATAFLLILEKQHHGTINLGTGTGVTIREIANELTRLLNRPGLIKELDPPQPDPLPYVVADSTRLKTLGWSPRVTLVEGLERLIESQKPQVAT